MPSNRPIWPWVLLAVVALVGLPVMLNRPRGIRNNNPGNLRPMPSNKWLGELAPDTAKGGPFSRFQYPWQGWRAMTIDVYGDVLRDGLNTIAKLVHEYAPSADNNNEADYTRALTKALKIGANFPLNIYLHGPDLVKAIATHENGSNPDLVWGAGERLKGVNVGLEHLQAQGVA